MDDKLENKIITHQSGPLQMCSGCHRVTMNLGVFLGHFRSTHTICLILLLLSQFLTLLAKKKKLLFTLISCSFLFCKCFNPLCTDFCIWCVIGIQVHSLTYSVFPASFTEGSTLCLLCISIIFAENQLTINMLSIFGISLLFHW